MDTPTAPILTAEAVEVSFGARPVLRGVDLAIHEGGSLALVGAAGSGRSTLLRALNRTEPIDAGSIRFRGEPLPDGGPALATLRADVALVLPTFNLPPNHPVRDTIVASARRIRGWPDERARTAADGALARVDASEVAHLPAGELASAAALRVALARALALEAQVLLLDDPTSALDEAAAHVLRTLLAELGRELTLVLATGDGSLVHAVATRVVRLDAGQVVGDRSVDDVLDGA